MMGKGQKHRRGKGTGGTRNKPDSSHGRPSHAKGRTYPKDWYSEERKSSWSNRTKKG